MQDVFLKHIDDLVNQCGKYCSPRFSYFLDEKQQTEVESMPLAGVNYALFGGFDEAERRIFGVFPEWYGADEVDFPIEIIKFTKKFDKDISHRNYLGTILSLGVDRNRIGDILIDEKCAYAFVFRENSEFICRNIRKVAGCGVETEIVKLSEAKLPQRRFELISSVAASLRLDAVLAAALDKSRNFAKEMIKSGRVSVNHTVQSDADFILKSEDLLSIRGFGRIRMEDIGGRTRSDRIHITLKKYI